VRAEQEKAIFRAGGTPKDVIQNNEPVFVFIWIGSAIAMVVCNVIGLTSYFVLANNKNADEDDDVTVDKILLTVSTVLYLIAQYTTSFTKNVPLNNHVKTLDIANLDSFKKNTKRNHFEGSWNFWNEFRGVIMWVLTMYLLSFLRV
jgi:uncharacterized membrane protein